MVIHLALACCLQAHIAGWPHLEFLASLDCGESRSTDLDLDVSRAHRVGGSSKASRCAVREPVIVDWYIGNWPICDGRSWSVEGRRDFPAGRSGRESVSDVTMASLRGFCCLFAMPDLLLLWRWPCSILVLLVLPMRLGVCGADGVCSRLPLS